MPRILRFIDMSSTTRTRSGSTSRIACSAARGTMEMFCTSSRLGMSMKNVVPLPSSLSARIVPPALSTMRFTIGRPSPVPLISPALACIRLAMSWMKGSKSLSSLSFEIPQPVSLISTCRVLVAPSHLTFTTISPRSVNFDALPTRLMSIWRIPCCASTTMGSSSCGGASTLSFTPWRRTR